MKGIPVTPEGNPLRVTLVIAGSHVQFRNWCMYSQVNPRSRNVRYVFRDEHLRGYSDIDLVYTGTWFDRPAREIDPIQYVISYYNATGRLKKVYAQYESADIEPNVIR